MFIIGKVVPLAFVPVIAVIGHLPSLFYLSVFRPCRQLTITPHNSGKIWVNGYYGRLSFTVGAHKKGSKAQSLERFR
jgi:hypothetical protein